MNLEDRLAALQSNFYLSLSLLETAQNGKLVLDRYSYKGHASNKFDFPHETSSSTSRNRESLLPAVRNNLQTTFAFTAVELDTILKSVFSTNPINETDNTIKYVRCVVHLLAVAFINDPMYPIWQCDTEFQTVFYTHDPYREFDCRELNGTAVSWDHFGGIEEFVDILNLSKSIINDKAASDPFVSYEVNNHKSRNKRHTKKYQNIRDFVNLECVVNNDKMSLAGDLYEAYTNWSNDLNVECLSQRGFGLGLREFGFVRKRRGQGKHWWLGISLIKIKNEQISLSLDL